MLTIMVSLNKETAELWNILRGYLNGDGRVFRLRFNVELEADMFFKEAAYVSLFKCI